MTDSTFRKLDEEDERLYGPQAVLLSGFSPDESQALRELIHRTCGEGTAVVGARGENAHQTVGSLLEQADGTGLEGGEPLARAIIMSGLLQKELHGLMAGYRGLSWPRPLFAALTPHSERWALQDLLKELGEEHAAMQAARNPGASGKG